MTSSALLRAQAKSELEMFYLLTVEQGVLMMAAFQSSGTQTGSASIERLENAAPRLTGALLEGHGRDAG